MSLVKYKVSVASLQSHDGETITRGRQSLLTQLKLESIHFEPDWIAANKDAAVKVEIINAEINVPETNKKFHLFEGHAGNKKLVREVQPLRQQKEQQQQQHQQRSPAQFGDVFLLEPCA